MIVPLQCSPFLQKLILGEVKYDAISNEDLNTMIAPLLKHFDVDTVTTMINNICHLSNITINGINNESANKTGGHENDNKYLESQQFMENECYDFG